MKYRGLSYGVALLGIVALGYAFGLTRVNSFLIPFGAVTLLSGLGVLFLSVRGQLSSRQVSLVVGGVVLAALVVTIALVGFALDEGRLTMGYGVLSIVSVLTFLPIGSALLRGYVTPDRGALQREDDSRDPVLVVIGLGVCTQLVVLVGVYLAIIYLMEIPGIAGFGILLIFVVMTVIAWVLAIPFDRVGRSLRRQSTVS